MHFQHVLASWEFQQITDMLYVRQIPETFFSTFPANICWSWRRLQDMFSELLQNAFSITIFRLPRRLEDVLQRRLEDVLQRRLGRRLENVLKDKKLLRWRRLEDVLKTFLEDVWKTCLQEVLKMSSRRFQDMSSRRLGDKQNVYGKYL